MKSSPLRGLEIEIGFVLRAGVTLAAAIVILGAFPYLLHEGFRHVDYHAFRSEPASLRGLAGVSSGAIHGSGRAIMQAGLIVLIATPVLRVALSAVVFARQKDWIYTAFTVLVLALLGYGLFA